MVKLKPYFKSLNESITVNRYDNGYMVEVSGRDHEDEWPTKKFICSDLKEVFEILTEAHGIALSN